MDNPTSVFQQQMLLGMMQQHISNGLPLHYAANYADQILNQSNDDDTSNVQSIIVEQDENEQTPTPVVYKKRARIKFTQEQLDILEATFQQHRYPSVDIVDDLVEQLNLPTQKITVWFQNRRARLKKIQQKLDEQQHQQFENDEQQQQQDYDSGIHLDEDVSHVSPTFPPSPPPSNLFLHRPPLPSNYFTSLAVSSSPYYLPNPHQAFYNTMWHNLRYSLPTPPFQPTMNTAPGGVPFNLVNYGSAFSPPPPPEIHSPFVFQDTTNYQQQYQTDFHSES